MANKFKRGEVVTYVNFDGEDKSVVIVKSLKDIYSVLNLDEGYADDVFATDIIAKKGKVKPWSVTRAYIDGYVAIVAVKGSKTIISMGCRWFTNMKDARWHWSNDDVNSYWGDNGDLDTDRKAANTKRLRKVEQLYKKAKEA